MSSSVTAPHVPIASTGNGATHSVVVTNFIRLNPPEPTPTRHDVLDRLEADRLTPPARVLLEMAKKSPPPQSWWDEDFGGL
jgi:hypothetical protein